MDPSQFNPLTSRRIQLCVLFHQNFNFILRRDHQKVSYESDDEKSLLVGQTGKIQIISSKLMY